MKKLLLLLVLCVSLEVLGSDKKLRTLEVDGVTFYFYTKSNDATTATITNTACGESGANTACYFGEIVIPSQVYWGKYTYDVVEFGSYAFDDCGDVTSVVVPEGVTYIGEQSFRNCSSLTSIVLPSTVDNIGGYAFQGCVALPSIEIPENLTSLGRNVFQGCGSLTTITFPEAFVSIERAEFAGCASLESFVVKDGCVEISMEAFMGCESLKYIYLPEGIKTIYSYAFYGCSSLPSINLPSTLTKIDERAFMECIALSSIVIPDNVTELANEAFYGCSLLKYVVIPASVTSMKEKTFRRCESLKAIYMKHTEIPSFYYQSSFNECDPDCILYVQQGMKDAFYEKLSYIFDYDHIVELKAEEFPTEFPEALPTITSPDAYEIGRYNLQGQKLSGETKGINIIRYSDGTTQKVLVK